MEVTLSACLALLHLASFHGVSCWKNSSSSAGSKLSHGQLHARALLLLLSALKKSWAETWQPQERADGLGGGIWKEAQSPCLPSVA